MDFSLKAFECKNCGAAIAFSANEQAMYCDFCGSSYVIDKTVDEKDDDPRAIAPVLIDQKQATDIFSKWRAHGWFVANSYEQVSASLATMKMTCVYIPFWYFEISAASEWTGQWSQTHYRTVSKVRKVFMNGRDVEQLVTESEPYQVWFQDSGARSGSYTETIPASKMLTEKEHGNIKIDNEFKEFSEEYLSGWRAQFPEISREEGATVAATLVRGYERVACSLSIERLDSCATSLSFDKHALLYFPVWIIHYNFEGKEYRAIINGRTGEIFGARPISRRKVMIFSGAVAGIFFSGWIAWQIHLSSVIGGHLQHAERAIAAKSYDLARSHYESVLSLNAKHVDAADGMKNVQFYKLLESANQQSRECAWEAVVGRLTEATALKCSPALEAKSEAERLLASTKLRILQHWNELAKAKGHIATAKWTLAEQSLQQATLAWGKETDSVAMMRSQIRDGVAKAEKQSKYMQKLRAANDALKASEWDEARQIANEAQQILGERTPDLAKIFSQVQVEKDKIEQAGAQERREAQLRLQAENEKAQFEQREKLLAQTKARQQTDQEQKRAGLEQRVKSLESDFRVKANAKRDAEETLKKNQSAIVIYERLEKSASENLQKLYQLNPRPSNSADLAKKYSAERQSASSSASRARSSEWKLKAEAERTGTEERSAKQALDAARAALTSVPAEIE